MALISVIDDFEPLQDERLLKKAAALAPALHREKISPASAFYLRERYSADREPVPMEALPRMPWKKGENICLDFGNHQVGYLTLLLGYEGSHPDAPAHIKLKFAENLKELSENTSNYNGWVSGSWIQEEVLHVDVLPSVVKLPRRYAFRYLKITVLNTSPKYRLVIRRAECETVTSADDALLPAFSPRDTQLAGIYRMCLRTLRGCMQDVFEDGPKRDRRMWMGDLRLQALVNYASYRNLDLVKRSLYLFAGSRFPDGRIAACIFTEPEPEADDTCLFDYMLFYPALLEEYLETCEKEKVAPEKTAEVLEDLYAIAQQQIDLALAHVDDAGLVHGEELGTVFVDWAEDMDKDGCAQAILIYAMEYAAKLAVRKGDSERENFLQKKRAALKQAAREHFWCEKKQCFISGGQAALATQTWMVLAGVATEEEAQGIFDRADDFSKEYRMTTPYMHHYYIMALLSHGRTEQALGHIRWYWGGMVEAGMDTCPETWVPGDPDASPYGGAAVNSYCHAWSCTPAYLLPAFFWYR